MARIGRPSTVEARRRELVDAAVTVFAARGFFGTTTAQVAAAAGISQPYVYRLFPDKESLFVSAVERAGDRLLEVLAGAGPTTADGRRDPVRAVSEAYLSVAEDRDLVLFLLQANGAAQEPRIREALLACYAKQVEFVQARTGATPEQVRAVFGLNLLGNVVLAARIDELDAPWARVLSGR